MSSRYSVPVVDLTLRSSPLSVIFVTSVTILAVVAVYFSSMGVLAKVMAMTLIPATGGYWVLDSGLRIMPSSITRVTLLQDDECVISDRKGRARSVNLTGGVELGSLCAVLSFREGRRRTRTVCLFCDSVARDLHRRIRMRLRVPACTQASLCRRLVRRFYERVFRKSNEKDFIDSL